MKSSNAELVAQLEEAIAGLLFPTENYYRFKTFVCEVAEQGLTLDKILQSAGIINYVKIDDFLQIDTLVKACWMPQLSLMHSGAADADLAQ